MAHVREVRGREGGRRREDGLDLYLCGLCIGGAHDAVLSCGYPVERANGVGGIFARDLGVGVAHKRVPDLDGAAALEDVNPHGASGARAVEGMLVAKRAGHSLGKRLIIGAEEFKESVGIRLNVELHLPLFHNLCRVSARALQAAPRRCAPRNLRRRCSARSQICG